MQETIVSSKKPEALVVSSGTSQVAKSAKQVHEEFEHMEAVSQLRQGISEKDAYTDIRAEDVYASVSQARSEEDVSAIAIQGAFSSAVSHAVIEEEKGRPSTSTGTGKLGSLLQAAQVDPQYTFAMMEPGPAGEKDPKAESIMNSPS